MSSGALTFSALSLSLPTPRFFVFRSSLTAASSGNRTERCSLASVLWLIKTVSENTALCKVEKGKRQAAEQRLLELGKHNNNSGNGFTSGDNDLLNGNNGCHVETLALAKVHVRTDSSSNLPSFGDDCDDMPAKPLQQLSNNFGASKRNLFGGNGNDENEVSFQQPEKNSAKLQQENKRLRDSVNSLTSKLAAMKAEKKRLHEEEERKKKGKLSLRGKREIEIHDIVCLLVCSSRIRCPFLFAFIFLPDVPFLLSISSSCSLLVLLSFCRP